MKAFKITVVCFIILIIVLAARGIYLLSNLTTAEKDKFTVTASDGTKFEVLYTLYNFPDLSYSLDIYGKNGEMEPLFSGDESGEKDIMIQYLYEKEAFKYYLVEQKDYQSGNQEHKRILLITSEQEFSLGNENKYIDTSDYDGMLTKEFPPDYLRIIYPLAEERIINHNEGDYVYLYAESLIQQGNQEILKKLKQFVDGAEPFTVQCYSRDAIIYKSRELLENYGGDQ